MTKNSHVESKLAPALLGRASGELAPKLKRSTGPKQRKRADEPELWKTFQRRGTIRILLELNTGPKTPTELREQMPFVAHQVIGRRLHELDSLGILARRVAALQPNRAFYQLTEEGERLAMAAEVLNSVAPWDRSQPATEGLGDNG